MKKVLLALTVVAAMASCTKDQDIKAESNCNCGTITDVAHIVEVDTTTIDLYLNYYDYKVENNCTGVKDNRTTRFQSPLDDNAIPVVGNEICK